MRSLSQIIICLFIGLSAFAQSPHGGDLNISCSGCHNESGWKLIEGQYAFDHQTTGFVLSGQHRQTDCRECHSTLIFNQASPSCISCHADIHEQTTGPDCAQCHNSDTWLVNNITQIHQMGRFPLLGAHFTADCYACHPSASKLRFEPLGIECIDCHEQDFQATTSPNHVTGNFSTNCIECHFQNAFTWTGSSINHDFFPLTKGHQLNDCRSCHEQGTYQGLSPDCFSCHQTDFQATVNPNHQAINLSTTCTDCHTTDPGWRPAEFRIHDGEYFPIYSGKHNGEWNSCTDCHEVPSNYAQFTCISCHEHNKNDMDDEHGDVGGYIYESQACLECHPAGNAEDGFNHNLSNFPLTGAHITTQCADCHQTSYAGTPSECSACHMADFNETSNPNHTQINLGTDCASCHTTQPEWKPAQFDVHNEYYVLAGAHASIANECMQCHNGNYVSTPNTCYACHTEDYNQTNDPPHESAQFSTDCMVCHTESAWQPSTFEHDAQYFPIYSGKHNNEWTSCNECHTTPANYTLFSCIDCHEHNQSDMNQEHQGIGGYQYNSLACFECHPTGSADEEFNHNSTNFPLTGAHTSTECAACHTNGYSGTPMECFACHDADFNQTNNPNHQQIGLSQSCETCHTTNAGWNPATFPVHNDYYVLMGAHTGIANDCVLCHNGNYNDTPNTCYACHDADFNQTNNPNHQQLGLSQSCEICHTTNAGWNPATFPVHNDYYVLMGAHTGIANDCILCHNGNYNNTPNTCYACHTADYNQTTNPPHASAQFPTECETCHTQSVWDPSTFNHDAQYFPIYSGKHNGEWDLCADCHTNPSNYAVFSCIDCHEHNQASMNNEHQGVSGYEYNSAACLACHPDGSDKFMMHNRKSF